MRVTLPLIHLDELVFTPLPQLSLKAYAVWSRVCKEEEVAIIEFSREDDLADTLRGILATRPDVVGFSCYVWNFLVVEKLSRAIKELLGDRCLVVWGGPHVSEKPLDFAQRYALSVDLVVAWYGEKTFAQLLELWPEHSPVGIAERIPGVWSRAAKGSQQAVEFVPLSQLPSPHVYDWFPNTVTDRIADRVFLVETYRNCPFSCGYCLWGQAENRINGLSAGTAIEYFDSLIAQGARNFKFADAGLGLLKDRDKEIFRHFIDAEIWRLNVHIRTYYFWQILDEEWCEILKLLIDKKVVGQLDVGIQTFNANTLAAMKRPTNYEKFDQVMTMLQAWGLPYSIDLILGLPGDDLEGWRHSVRRALAYKPRRYQSFLCSILPGTAYDLQREKFGIKTIHGSLMDDDEKVIQSNTFSFAEMATALDIEAWLYFAFSINLCSSTMRLMAEASGCDLLEVVDDLRDWAGHSGPVTSSAVSGYRSSLYDSRQKGRLCIETAIFRDFVAITDELHRFVGARGGTDEIHDVLDAELMAFPKDENVIRDLEQAGRIQRQPGGTFVHVSRNGTRWEYSPPRSQPIPGVIGTKYSYWTWTAQLIPLAPL